MNSPLSTWVLVVCDRCGDILLSDLANVTAQFHAFKWRGFADFHFCTSCVGARIPQTQREARDA